MDALKSSPLVAFVAALVITLLFTPFVKRLGWKFGAVAVPDARRKHPEPIAMWGGLAVFLGVFVAALLWRQPTINDVRLLAPSGNPADVAHTASTLKLTSTFLLTGFLMVVLGMIDDRYELSAARKMGGQILIVALLWYLGVRIRSIPFSGGLEQFPDWASFLVTLIWILGLVNAVNFIDGVDGLASGVCAIAAGSLCLILLSSASWAAAASAALCGACIGFLRYNFHPAKIFLGDTGSMLLGFWLGTIAIASNAKAAAATTLILPLVVMGVPVFDTLWAIVRRSLARQAPWKADRGHIHHRLLARGLTPVKTVLVLYSISFVLGASAVIYSWVSSH